MKIFSFPWAAAAFVCWSGLAFSLPSEPTDLIQVNGTVSGLTTANTDNLVDGAIVLPSLSAEDLFRFQIDQFIGPPETMTVGGLFKAEVPSNFFFPKQRERWGLFPVSFEKESFYILAEKGDRRELVAAWFQLPFDKMVDMANGDAPPTAMLPHLKIKKHGFLTEQDWSSVSSINMKIDRDLSTQLRYRWERSPLTGNDMDGAFLFQGTSTGRWVMANLKGNPATEGGIESIKGLEDQFKVIFMRTHAKGQDISSAEGYIRSATLADKITLKGLPPALVARINSKRIEWTPIAEHGWMNLSISPKEEEMGLLPSVASFFAIPFLPKSESLQVWLDPKQGSTEPLSGNALENTNIALSFIGTTHEVPMPEEGQDSNEFLEAASEIRMLTLQ